MEQEHSKSNAEVALSEAISVLQGLHGEGILAHSRAESDASLRILLYRARNMLAPETMSLFVKGRKQVAEGFKGYEDHEVLGIDKDGQVICWDVSTMNPYASGVKLSDYGVINLKEHELVRVGVTVEQWQEASLGMMGDRARQPGWTRNVFVKADSTSEYGGDGPSYAKVIVSNQFLARLLRLAKMCETESFSEIRIQDEPDVWGGCDQEELRLQSPELVVTSTSFWFTASPKHSNHLIETDLTDIASFIKQTTIGEGDVYFATDEDELRSAVEMDQETEGL